jgi:galactitol-specific phosphotransferase system IIC component
MAGIDDLFKNGLGGGIALAVGVAVVGPMVAPVLGRVMKPVIKNAIKGGIVLYGWGREGMAEMREYVEDTYAEAHAEMVEESQTAARGRGRAKAETGS